MSPPPLFDGDVEVFDAGERLLNVGQLVIVGGEERLCAQTLAVGGVFQHGAGDGHAVEGRGAAADLV